MRYRLRTLLIVVTCVCVVFAWVAYLKRLEHHHRQQAAHLMERISITDNLKREKVKESIQWLAEGTAKEVRSTETVNGRTIVSFRNQPPFFQADSAAWEEAIYHQKMAAVYGEAAYYPWTLLSKDSNH